MTPVLPWWLVFPISAGALLIVTAHLLALLGAKMDSRRRRLRVSTNVLLMVLIPLLGYGFGVARPDDARRFALVWGVCTGLLLTVVVLAVADMIHSLTIHRRSLRRLRTGLPESGQQPRRVE